MPCGGRVGGYLMQKCSSLSLWVSRTRYVDYVSTFSLQRRESNAVFFPPPPHPLPCLDSLAHGAWVFVLSQRSFRDTHTHPRTRRKHAQKKKVHDLGELPALDWSNASRKLLITILVVGVILFTIYSGWMDECVRLGKFCLREWMNGLCAAVAAYFVIELLAKVRSLPNLLRL